MRASNAPMVLWDYCIQRRAAIHNATSKKLFQNEGLTPYECTYGIQGDISNICQFGWYEWIYYRDHGFPINKEKLGKVLGPLKNEGNEMAQAVLTYEGTLIPRKTIRRLRVEELHSPVEIDKRRLFDDVIRRKLGDASSFPTSGEADPDLEPYAYDEVDELQTVYEDDPVEDNGVAQFEAPLTDLLIHSEVHLSQGEEMKAAKVIRRSKNSEGEVVGEYNKNPILNTLIYDVEFPDGDVHEYSANIKAENIYAQIDSEGFVHTLLDHISDYKKDGNAIEKSDAYVVTNVEENVCEDQLMDGI